MIFSEVLEIIANLATILGVPIAIIIFLREKRRDREENAIRAFETVDDKYSDFLELCSKYPHLHCYLYSDDTIELSEEERIQRINLYEILICVFERGFVFYNNQPAKIKTIQWKGWNDYTGKWLEKESFKEAWNLVKATYDTDFVKFMDSIQKTIEKGTR